MNRNFIPAHRKFNRWRMDFGLKQTRCVPKFLWRKIREMKPNKANRGKGREGRAIRCAKISKFPLHEGREGGREDEIGQFFY